ncbi:[citrate (pro-3S)-lyase] ligase [Orbus sturtevantii]|uniref:[citrate (pro-3S)-lyase] ligase n=1 Tax=Orbus sturtevantii TaxID=3074109 RepID=UPI00370D149F
MIQLTFKTLSSIKDQAVLDSIKNLLQSVDLNLDPQIDNFIIGLFEQQIIACAGLDHNVIKCVAVHPNYQGSSVTLSLIQQVIELAHDKGLYHLFLYTKPENIDLFKACGFYPIVELNNTITLMENTPVGISHYCQSLIKERKPDTCGAIVMNANPFTNGHLYLTEQAAKQVDWLYIFVVSEDASLFSADVRYRLVKEGVRHLSNVTVLPGSPYIISKATFPSYFLKEQTLIEQSYMAIDLLIFRQYIAPALSIAKRFVGTEPHSEVTNAYNHAMMDWLQSENKSTSPIIEVIEIARVRHADEVISASRVRSLLMQKKYQDVHALVPPSTWAYIEQHYVIKNQ